MNSISVSHFSVLFVFVLVASLLFQSDVVRSDPALIQKVCNNTPFPALCVTSLNSSPKGASTYVPDLGLAMVDVLTAKSNAASDTIKKLMGTRPDLAGPLATCLNIYTNGIVGSFVPPARKAFSTGLNFKFALNAGRDAAFEANNCESSFAQGQSPLTATNNDAHDIALIVAGIAQQLL